jgi:phospholipid-binding lipoprotein MlaA
MQLWRENSRVGRTGAALLLVALLGACASSVPEDQRSESDPWETLNRSIYSFNTNVDKATLKPLAKGYEKVIPKPVRRGISNFFRNLGTPASSVNNFLQGKPSRGFSELGRFVFNSTLGVGGIFDVATAGGLEAQFEDFGQTAAVWGVPDGPYVMIPFMAPSTLRDTLLFPLFIVSSPLYHYDNTSVRDKLYVLRAIDVRARLLPAEKILEESKDPYITLRESYLQNREYEIYDGEPPEQEDEFYDEFLEEEYLEEDETG